MCHHQNKQYPRVALRCPEPSTRPFRLKAYWESKPQGARIFDSTVNTSYTITFSDGPGFWPVTDSSVTNQDTTLQLDFSPMYNF